MYEIITIKFPGIINFEKSKIKSKIKQRFSKLKVATNKQRNENTARKSRTEK
jgi:hypothetical protein